MDTPVSRDTTTRDMIDACSSVMAAAEPLLDGTRVSPLAAAWCGDAHDIATTMRSALRRQPMLERSIGVRRITEAALTVFVECAGELRQCYDDEASQRCADACEHGSGLARELLRGLVEATDQESSGAT